MNLLKLSVVCFFLISLIPHQAQAREWINGVFLEPSLTYEFGNTDINYPSPLSNSTGEVQGFGVGGRLGIHIAEILFFGIDGRYSIPRFKDSAFNSESDSTAYNWGPVIGVQMPELGIRGWGTVIVDGALDPDSSGDFDAKFEEAQGFRLGVGFRVMTFSLNVEYQQLDYGNAVLEQLGPFNPGDISGVELQSQTWIASISFPVEL